MTADERHAIRLAIDDARRRALAKVLICEYCGHEMEPHPQGQPKRFCSKSHRTLAWYRTERGRETSRLAKRRRRRRQGVPHRPTHEVA